MRRLQRFALIVCALICPALVYGQGGVPASPINFTGPTGRPLAGATVTACTSVGTGFPCSPLASIFTNAGLTLASPNPVTTDGNGNIPLIFAAPGVYVLSVTGSGITSTLVTATVAGTGGGNVVLSANNVFTGNNTFTAGQNTGKFYNINAQRVVDGNKFTTIEAAQTDCLNDATIKGCIIVLPSGFRETFTSTIVLGTATQSVILWGMPDAVVTCNVSAGADCWQVHSTSGFFGHSVGELGSSPRTAGFVLQTAATANVGNFIVPTWCGGLTSEGSFLKMDNVFIQFASGAVMTTGLNLCNLNNQPAISNIFINGATTNTTQLLIQPGLGAGAFLGPITLTNVFTDCVYTAGCRPAKVITGANPNDFSVVAVAWNGGYINHPGSGLPNIELNGAASANKPVRGIGLNGIYFENLQNGATIAVKIVDVFNVTLLGDVFAMQDTDTCIDISQTGAGRTGAIHLGPYTCRSNTSLVTAVNNHIDATYSVTTGTSNFPFYNFGGDSSSGVGRFVIGDNILAGPLFFGGAGAMTSTPGFVGPTEQGWRYCVYSNLVCDGLAPSTRVHTMSGASGVNWESWFAGSVSNNNATANTPDTTTGFSIGSNGSTVWKEVAAPTGPGVNFENMWGDSGDHFLHYNPNNAGNQQIPQIFLVGATYTNATTTFSNLTNMTFTAKASTNYTMSCKLYLQGSATTAGPKFQLTGPASPTSVTLAVGPFDPIAKTTTNVVTGAAFASPNTTFGTIGALGVNYEVDVTATIRNGVNAGAVALQAAANGAGTLTVQADSSCRVQ